MSKAKRIKAQQRHERLRMRKEQELAERAQVMEEGDDEGRETGDGGLEVRAVLPPDEPEDLEKMYDESMGEMGMMNIGPTSFEELEAQRDAMERAHEVQEVTWDVQDLVRNILHNPMIEPVDKSTKIKAVADEFEERLAEALMDAEDMEKDLDILQVEAILATDARHTGAFEKVGDLIKAKLSAAARKKLSSEDFALPSKKKYPIHDKCLHGDVEIALLDGTSKPIRDLVGQEVWVYAFDEIQKAVVPALAKNIRRTVVDEEMLMVHLDNNEIVVCTLDHRFLMREGSYREAQDLKPGDSIMPLYRKHVLLQGKKPYEQVYQPWYRFWEWTHHMAHREYYGVSMQNGYVIHHEDDNHFNNCPTNLTQMSRGTHSALHREMLTDARVSSGASKKRWERPGERERQSEVMRKENESRKLDGRSSIIGKKISDAKLGPLAVDDSLVEEIYGKYINGSSYAELEIEYSVSRPTIKKHFGRLGFLTKREIGRLNNHKIVRVEEFGCADGYDMEVPNFHNFALTSGIFVHNSHVRNALARAAQQMKRGGEGAADAKAAMPKIRAAAKRMGIEMGMEKSAILIEKDAKGDWRWIGKPTNNFIDWEEDIISKSAHQGYAAWLDENPELAPVFLTWHVPGTAREHPADFWMEQDGAFIMSGVLTENEAAALFKAQVKTDLGMSFQGLGMRLDKSDPRVVTNYWMYEVSDLPLDKAANPFTTLETMIKEVGMDKLEYLTTIMGSKEKAEDYLAKTGQMQKQLAEAGITSKEKGQETEDGGQKTEITTSPVTATLPVDVKAILEQVAKELDVEGLNAFVAQAQESLAKVEILEELVKSLQSSTEDKLAEMLEPPAARFAWSKEKRPTASDKTKLKKDAGEDDKLAKAVPGVPDEYWLNKLTNTVPVSIETS